MQKDYYNLLGISKDASPDEIKRAFHKLAHKHHPHKGGDEGKFKEINEAYQVLSNKEKRQQYDQLGRVSDGPGSANWAWGQGAPNIEFDVEDLNDIFGDIFGRGSRKKDLRRGEDIRLDIEVPLEAVLNKIDRDVKIFKQVVCHRCYGKGAEPGSSLNECFSCRGTGEVQQVKRTFLGSFTRWGICPECKGEGQKPEKTCNVCQGNGRTSQEEIIKINIPAGIDSQQVIEMPGRGEAGKRGGSPGNLYVRILVKKHKVFERRGDNLLIEVPIAFSQSVLGDKIEIPTLEGDNYSLKIPAGLESGQVLRISKRGIPRFSRFGRGDLYVRIVVKIPKHLTKEQKMLLNKMREQGL